MPASQEYEIWYYDSEDEEREIVLGISGRREKTPEVYLTGKEYLWKINLENKTDKPIVFDPDMTWRAVIKGSEEHHSTYPRGELTFPYIIQPGDSKTANVKLEPNFQMTSELMVGGIEIDEEDDQFEDRLLATRSSGRKTVMTFTAWDPDFYNLNYELPRNRQLISVLLVAIVAVTSVFNLTGVEFSGVAQKLLVGITFSLILLYLAVLWTREYRRKRP